MTLFCKYFCLRVIEPEVQCHIFKWRKSLTECKQNPADYQVTTLARQGHFILDRKKVMSIQTAHLTADNLDTIPL